jgi:hypothetical protein
MIQGAHDVSLSGSAHVDAPPHPDCSGDALHRHGNPTSPRKRGEVNSLTLLREKIA